MTDTLVAFLRRMLDDDQRIAEATRQASRSWGTYEVDGEVRDGDNAGTVCFVPHPEDRDHIARHDPARVIREIAAKRAIIDAWQRADEAARSWPDNLIIAGRDALEDDALRHLAAVYADHPDYRTEWKP